ncbi:hypothetical protein QW060_08895 [Myroides ceti]|uniref:Uncharacterized protein n=1 Tax=Paenimyroides ceti TaxID=395087 RepID=A0ABT8CTC9_9FLAO|nr:hypothetical protein [Paenimyroides ceti]MDN3707251.1 hypothetical protein [Paenimyroides ceti]
MLFFNLNPKQKLFKYIMSTSSNNTDDIPTSSAVSDEVVKKISPYFTLCCFSLSLIST